MAAESLEHQPNEEDNLLLAPGFRFHPTDEEIITCYLSQKVTDRSFTAVAMGEVDLNKCEPWDLPKKAKMMGEENEWYFFSQKERRYPTGMRTNRATESGYWKATGKDKEIHKGKGSLLVGMKKTLVFYKGRAPKGEKTNWVMHEFRLQGNCSRYFTTHLPKSSSNSKDDWVVVRVFHKNDASKKSSLSTAMECDSTVNNSNQSRSFFPHSGSSSIGCLHQSPFVAQFSNSMVSTNSRDDTALSNDWNVDISSYDLDGPSSGPLFDLENIWNY